MSERGDEFGDAAEVFSVSEARPLLDAYIDTFSFEDARSQLGMTRSQLEVLIKAKLLRPTTSIGSMRPVLARRELEQFSSALEARLVSYDPEAPVVPLPSAIKQARVSVPKAVKALLDGSVPAMRRLGAGGFQEILVHPEVLRAAIHGPRDPSTLTVREVLELLSVPQHFVRGRIRVGVLGSRREQLVRSNAAAVWVPRRDLDAFLAAYVSEGELAQACLVGRLEVRARLKAAGLPKAFDPKGGQAFYRRDEVTATLSTPDTPQAI